MIIYTLLTYICNIFSEIPFDLNHSWTLLKSCSAPWFLSVNLILGHLLLFLLFCSFSFLLLVLGLQLPLLCWSFFVSHIKLVYFAFSPLHSWSTPICTIFTKMHFKWSNSNATQKLARIKCPVIKTIMKFKEKD